MELNFINGEYVITVKHDGTTFVAKDKSKIKALNRMFVILGREWIVKDYSIKITA